MKKNLCANAIEDITDRNSASFDASCLSLSIWHVVSILDVCRLLLDNERSGIQFSQAHC